MTGSPTNVTDVLALVNAPDQGVARMNNNPRNLAVLTTDSNQAMPCSTATLAEVSRRHRVSISFLRKEIARGRLRAIVLAPNSHRKKLRVSYRDELAWLEACTPNAAS